MKNDFRASLTEICILEELAQLFVRLDCEHEMARVDALLLVVGSFVGSELEDFLADVLQSSGQDHRSTCTNPFRILPLLTELSNSAYWELSCSFGRSSALLCLHLLLLHLNVDSNIGLG